MYLLSVNLSRKEVISDNCYKWGGDMKFLILPHDAIKLIAQDNYGFDINNKDKIQAEHITSTVVISDQII